LIAGWRFAYPAYKGISQQAIAPAFNKDKSWQLNFHALTTAAICG
jgi:hypothetical protein